MLPPGVSRWLVENGYGEVTSTRSVGGGCINNGARIETSSGESFFLKTNRSSPADMFEREAEGLQALHTPDGPAVPKPYIWGADFLLLEDLKPAPRRTGYWRDFGRKLAALHGHTDAQFGFKNDNYIGSTPQLNPRMEDGYEFFAEHRLLFQARLARRKGLLESREVSQVENLAGRLPELAPAQPASLVHGDLWSGNAISDAQGGLAIIDPAAHYGWAETELAMTTLFGSFPEEFYRAYQETRPLEKDFRKRFPLYNLYHLLNHLNLFGTGYLGQVQSILSLYR